MVWNLSFKYVDLFTHGIIDCTPGMRERYGGCDNETSTGKPEDPTDFISEDDASSTVQLPLRSTPADDLHLDSGEVPESGTEGL